MFRQKKKLNPKGTTREVAGGSKIRGTHLGEGVGESGTGDAGANDDHVSDAGETRRRICRGIATERGCRS